MKVVHVVWSTDDRTGGLARAVTLIAAAQARSGLQVVIATTGDAGSPTGPPDRFAVHAFPRDRWSGRFAGSRALRRWLAQEVRPDDVVHVHAIWDLASVAGARAARRAGARLVVSPHGSLEPFDLRKHARAKRLLGPLFIRPALAAATVCCTTRREADCLVTYGARPDVAVLPLPLGDPPDGPGDAAAFRAAHRVPDGSPLLLFLGRVNYKKGLVHLLRALGTMATPAHLVIAGTGEPEHEQAMRALAAELGVADRVTWAGWVEGAAKRDAFASADLFVLLSDAENYGIAVVEAMQHGAVVVASGEVGSAEDLAVHDAVLLSPREPTEAAAHLDRYLADEGLRARTAAAADRVLADGLAPATLDPRYRELATGSPDRHGEPRTW